MGESEKDVRQPIRRRRRRASFSSLKLRCELQLRSLSNTTTIALTTTHRPAAGHLRTSPSASHTSCHSTTHARPPSWYAHAVLTAVLPRITTNTRPLPVPPHNARVLQPQEHDARPGRPLRARHP